MRPLGPRQREWLDKIEAAGGVVRVTQGWHGQVHYHVGNEVMPGRMAESLWEGRDLLVGFFDHNHLDRLVLRSHIKVR